MERPSFTASAPCGVAGSSRTREHRRKLAAGELELRVRIRRPEMKRLLIADDDAGMRAALEARFQRRGWSVDVAVDGHKRSRNFAPVCIRW